VVNIISGEVATNILRHDRGRKLPEGSLYTVLAAEFGGHVDRTPSKSSDVRAQGRSLRRGTGSGAFEPWQLLGSWAYGLLGASEAGGLTCWQTRRPPRRTRQRWWVR
jgi:hypothetical protein